MRLFFICFLYFSSLTQIDATIGNPPPTPSFSYSVDSRCSDFEISYTQNPPFGMRYFWQFANVPEFEGSKNESHSFPLSGYFDVKLRVEYPEYGSFESTKKNTNKIII